MSANVKGQALLEIKNLKKVFPSRRGVGETIAVDDLSLKIRRGQTFGLVGESGCGKTTAGRTVTRIYKPTDGEIWFDGMEVGRLDEKRFKPFRKRIQMIFQDPYESLDPRMTIGEIIREPLDIHQMETKRDRNKMVGELLNSVGLPKTHAGRYPHEFSGGQRQRIGIARALAPRPDLVVCDEPISALDLSVQAQIVNMLEELQEKEGLTYLFIAHDLSMVKHISDSIGVMHRGRLVERAGSEELYSHPAHPYTRALISSIPSIGKNSISVSAAFGGRGGEEHNISGGCGFRRMCPRATKICQESIPEMKSIGENHFCACHALG